MTSRDQAIGGINRHYTDKADEKKDRLIQDGDSERIETDGRKQYFSLRREWSSWIIGWITGLIGFNIILTGSVGLGWLRFENMHWFISSIMVQTFLEIVGLGYIAVRFLFSDRYG